MNQTEQATRTDASIVYELLVTGADTEYATVDDIGRYKQLLAQWRNQYRAGTDS